MTARLTLSNRLENLNLLKEFVQRWARERGLSQVRSDALTLVAGKIFRYLAGEAYQPGQSGSISIALEEQGARIRLSFEDDAPPYNPASPNPQNPGPGGQHNAPLKNLQNLADSFIYYRTTDRKNRLVLFITP